MTFIRIYQGRLQDGLLKDLVRSGTLGDLDRLVAGHVTKGLG
jgi:hypothetical protein